MRKDIKNFLGYKVDSDGNVFSYLNNKIVNRNIKGLITGVNKIISTKGRMIKQVSDKDGYMQVNIFNSENKRMTKKVHRLVLEAFVGECPYKNGQACHNDGDRKNNKLSNLRWDTVVGNIADKALHGTNRKRVLTTKQQKGILKMKEEYPNIKQKDLSKIFNASQSIISKVLNFNY